MPPETAVAVREDQHPIIQKIDEKMPEIGAMLPEGMHPDRFRRVVVQALVRNPDLWACTPVSVVSAIVESAQLGLEPTGVLGRAWMLPYSNKGIKEAKLIVGYRGYSELAWRADRILVKTGAVRDGDDFAYQRGTAAFLRHIPASDDAEREATDQNITDFWALYELPDGRTEFEVMSRKAVERIRDKARYRNPVWDSDFGEMGRKTVLRRLLKVAPLSPEVQRVLGHDEEIDFDTPVERVVDEKASAARERITARTDALRAGHPAPTAGDPWMGRIHGLGAARGIDHDKLHDYAVRRFGVESLKDLNPSQRADMTEAVEKQPLIEQPGSGVPTTPAGQQESTPSGDQGSVLATPPAATKPATASGQPDPSADAAVVAQPETEAIPPASDPAAPSLDEIVAATGGEVLPPKPGTDEYKALPSGTERANAKAYWDQKEPPAPKGARETHEPVEVTAGL